MLYVPLDIQGLSELVIYIQARWLIRKCMFGDTHRRWVVAGSLLVGHVQFLQPQMTM